FGLTTGSNWRISPSLPGCCSFMRSASCQPSGQIRASRSFSRNALSSSPSKKTRVFFGSGIEVQESNIDPSGCQRLDGFGVKPPGLLLAVLQGEVKDRRI